MSDTPVQAQMLYEIAMSIGNSLDLVSMLRWSLSTYIKKLGCSAGIVAEMREEPEGSFRFTPVYAIPRNAGFLDACKSAFQRIPQTATESEYLDFRAQLPIRGCSEGDFFYLMDLPGFGLLLLVKTGEPLEETVIGAVDRLNMKLAGACIACTQSDRIERINRELSEQIQNRTAIEAELKKVLRELEQRVEERTRELRSANEALISASQQFQNIIEFLPDSIVVLDNSRKVIAWNRAMEEITGVGKSEIIGKDNYPDVVPFYGSKGHDLIDRLDRIESGQEGRVDDLKRKGDKLCSEIFAPMVNGGRGAHLFAMAAPLLDAHGNRVGTIESIRDITEQKLAHEAISRAEEKYRSIFEHAVMGIFQVTPRGDLISANKAFARILGYDEVDDLLNSKSDLAWHLNTEGSRYPELVRGIEQYGVIQEFEFQYVRKNGSIAWISINARAVRDNNGRIDYLEGTAQDITGRKLLESRLLQAQKMEAIGTLAGGIAHDFNNILAAVLGFAEMTKLGLRDPKLIGYMEQVLLAGERAKSLVGQILAFSRADRQEKKPIDIGSIVEEARKLLRATLPSTLEICVSSAPDLFQVLADRTQIHQVIINLCTNSAHAIPETGGLIQIDVGNFEVLPDMEGLQADLEPGPYVKISVIDNGKGIDPLIMGRIFDPFFTTKKKGEGTGLGLSVVYGIISESGGAITVQSEPGQGTIFTVYLPGLPGEAQAAPQLAGSLPRGVERVLFVDDEELLVEMGRDMLEDLGYRVVATTDSIDALRLFRENPDYFDLVITDTTMPKLNGVEFSREVLKIRSDVAIIICTGYSELLDEGDAISMGIKKFIMKPFSVKSLAEAIRGVLDLRTSI